MHQKLKRQIKRIQHAKTLVKEINAYNSMVMYIHNYYNKATMVSHDVTLIQYNLVEYYRKLAKTEFK